MSGAPSLLENESVAGGEAASPGRARRSRVGPAEVDGGGRRLLVRGRRPEILNHRSWTEDLVVRKDQLAAKKNHKQTTCFILCQNYRKVEQKGFHLSPLTLKRTQRAAMPIPAKIIADHNHEMDFKMVTG